MTSVLRILVLGALIVLTGAANAVAQPPSGIVRPTTEPASPSVKLGAELYAGNCASCHGIAGSGIRRPRPGAGDLEGLGPSLRGVGAIAADLYLRLGFMPLSNPHSEPEQERVQFTETEIRSIVAYVASLGKGPGIPDPGVTVAGEHTTGAGSVGDGFTLFSDHCAGCHQIVARGGYVTGARVPPLQGLTPTEIAEAVRVGPYLMPRFPVSQISDAQLASIIKYVISTRDPDNHGGWGIGNLGPIPEGLIIWGIAIPLVLGACLLVSRRLSE